MNITIRKETTADHAEVGKLIRKAFAEEAYSDQTEHLLVEKLRPSEAFVPDLSLVAEVDGRIVGHILFTKVRIVHEETFSESLTLAPVSVLPKFQRKGIGSKLIEEGHRIAGALGFSSVVLIGHENYYPRFGYQRASRYGIRFPFDAPDENCMVIALTENGLEGARGMVIFPDAFITGDGH